MSTPSVSVIVPAHNAAATLSACLRSIQAAHYEGDVEIIVVDDASTDDTATIAESYGVHLVRRSCGGGPAAARNAGVLSARGDILIFVDSDTEMRRDTIESGVAALACEEVNAVHGMYEAEPLNNGFFARYYAYMKYHTFMSSDSDRVTAFGAQCGAIRRDLFRRLGGFREMPWGVDVENDEFGTRVGAIRLGRTFRVGHNFPGFRGLLKVFTRRVYWWVVFSKLSGYDEKVLMTNRLGLATAACPAAVLVSMAGTLLPGAFGTAIALVVALLLITVFASGYASFWRFCFRRRGLRFAAGSILATAGFSFAITASAAAAYLAVAYHLVTRQQPACRTAALGQL